MKRTLRQMWAPEPPATSSPSLPSPSPSATFAEHALVARDVMEEISVQVIESGVIPSRREEQPVAASVSSSEDEETPAVHHSLLSVSGNIINTCSRIQQPSSLQAPCEGSALPSALEFDRHVPAKNVNQKVSVARRVELLRSLHSLDPNDAVQRQRIFGMKGDRIYCGFCNISIKNKTDNVTRELFRRRARGQRLH